MYISFQILTIDQSAVKLAVTVVQLQLYSCMVFIRDK